MDLGADLRKWVNNNLRFWNLNLYTSFLTLISKLIRIQHWITFFQEEYSYIENTEVKGNINTEFI